MADITEKLILDDSQFTPVLEKSTKALEGLSKSWDGTQKEITESTKTISQDVTKSSDAQADAAKKVAEENRKASNSFVDYVKNIKVFGVSINDLLGKYDALKERQQGFLSILNSIGKPTENQAKLIGSIGKNSEFAVKGLTVMARGFNVLKAAIAASGIGLLILGLAALISYFTKTQEGINKVGQWMAYLSTATGKLFDKLSAIGKDIYDLFSEQGLIGVVKKFGETLLNAFLHPIDTIRNMGKAISDTAKEMNAAGQAAKALTTQRQNLEVQMIKLTVQEAKLRAEINASKKIAEDVTKSYAQRIGAAQKAFKLENDLLQQKINLQENIADNLKAEKSLTNSLIADDKEVAEAYAQVDRMRAESLEKQIELNNKINGLLTEAKTKLVEIQKSYIDIGKALGVVTEEEGRLFILEEQEKLLKSQVVLVKDLGNTINKDVSKEIEGLNILIKATQTEIKKVKPVEMLPSAEILATQKNALINQLADLQGYGKEVGVDVSEEMAKIEAQLTDLAKNPFPKGEIPKLTIELDLRVPEVDDPVKETLDEWLEDVNTFEELWNKILLDNFGPQATKEINEFFKGAGALLTSFNDILNESTDIQLANLDKQLQGLSDRREELEKGLDKEQELYEKGLANNLGTKQQEVDQIIAQEERLNKEKERLTKEAQRRQLIIDTAQQTQSLITASIQIIKGFANIPVVGLGLGIAASAALFAYFAKTKAEAFKATRLYTGADRVSDYFGYGDKYGDTDLPTHQGSGYRLVNERSGKPTNVIISGREMLLPEAIAQPNDTFFEHLKSGYYKGIDLTEAMTFYQNFKDLPHEKIVYKNSTQAVTQQRKRKYRQYVTTTNKKGQTVAHLVEFDDSTKTGSRIIFE